MAKRRDDWFVKAGQVWSLLIEAAGRGDIITYKEVGNIVGLHHRVVGYPLYIIQEYCLSERLPILSTIVVNAKSREPGRGSVAAGRIDINEIFKGVFEYPWASYPNPFAQFAPGEDWNTYARMLLSDPDESSEIYSRVRVRGVAQLIFRKAVAEAYGERCAICGLTFREALEAAHIIRWNEASRQERIDPRNGILLCATHHKLFDAGQITITEGYHVMYHDPDKIEGPYSVVDAQMSADLHGRDLFLPSDARLRPKPEWIKQRNEDDGWNG